jgi:hypothetical protein
MTTAIAVTIAAAEPARAGEDDGAYGRLDGDLDLRLDAGAAFAAGGPALAVSATALYLQTAGVYTHYTDALGGRGPDVARSIAVGVLLTPLFLVRYASNLEQGPARLDLFIDSIGIELGAFWDAPRGGALRPDPGLELGFVVGFPILPQVTGPFLGLRGALRFRADDIAGAPSGDILDRGAVLSLTLGWHQLVQAHLADGADRRRR